MHLLQSQAALRGGLVSRTSRILMPVVHHSVICSQEYCGDLLQ